MLYNEIVERELTHLQTTIWVTLVEFDTPSKQGLVYFNRSLKFAEAEGVMEIFLEYFPHERRPIHGSCCVRHTRKTGTLKQTVLFQVTFNKQKDVLQHQIASVKKRIGSGRLGVKSIHGASKNGPTGST